MTSIDFSNHQIKQFNLASELFNNMFKEEITDVRGKILTVAEKEYVKAYVGIISYFMETKEWLWFFKAPSDYTQHPKMEHTLLFMYELSQTHNGQPYILHCAQDLFIDDLKIQKNQEKFKERVLFDITRFRDWFNDRSNLPATT